MELLLIGLLGGIAIAGLFIYANSKKERLDKIERDVEELKKKDAIGVSEIASMKNTITSLDGAFRAHEQRVKEDLSYVVKTALAPVMVEIRHLNETVKELKK